jgi:CDP-6-deoxy-D-xylo-4-hexulose-3-dehydrase
MLKLQEVSYGNEEIKEVIDSLLTGYITMGKKNELFENNWNKWLGTTRSATCNSGSSANLLIISALCSPLLKDHFEKGDNIIVPATAWSTTYFPIIQNGLQCNLVDIDPKTLTIDVDKIEEAINSKTKAIFAVHLVGNVCEMNRLKEICKKHNLILIEDCCESHGAEWNNKKVGSFGLASSFSFMFAHHCTTGEGGVVSCNDTSLDNIIRIKRAHGWIRDVKDENYKKAVKKSVDNEIDDRYLFVDTGYNVRMNELQASFGIHQLNKLDNFIKIRRSNFNSFKQLIKDKRLQNEIQTMESYPESNPSPLAIPIICNSLRDKQRVVKDLEKHGVETRPIASGNIVRHPFFWNYGDNFIINDDLEGANLVHRQGFWIGNNQSITADQYVSVMNIIDYSLRG